MRAHLCPSGRTLLLQLLAAAALTLGACFGGGDTPPPPPERAAPGATSATPEPGALQFDSLKLFETLLPAGSLPASLSRERSYLVSNREVAAFFPDPEAAMRSMTTAGRVQGAAVDYRLVSAPRAAERLIAVSSSASWYRSSAGARGVIQDPTMELVIHRFGLHTAEVRMDRVGEESRAFRGFRDGDAPDFAAYLVLFRKMNVIGAVVVVVPATSDDGGRMALAFAQRQATFVR